ncbi:MAG: polyprenyl synthetase family protein [Caldisphaera sp.]|jgi:geranylgeranyl diphosphate synthase type I|nr:MAG: polyprenyl synthetase family protein [Caldisphaera sp.]
MEYSTLNKITDKYVSLIDSYIYDIMKGEPEKLYKASLHLIKAGGKRLRPMIVLASSKALGGPQAEAKAIYYATSIEILHNFSLVHDDIMDNDDFRRGIPTVHKVYGLSWALLAGDLMFSYAFLIPYLAKKAGADDVEISKAVEVIGESSKKIAEGQGFDIMFEKTWEVDEKDYLKMIYLKTGALIEGSSKLGGIASGSSEDIIELMGEYGRFVGLAFQIRDDIIGIFGDPQKTGKPIYNDLRRGKKTILVLYAANRKKEWKDLFMKIFEGNATEEMIKEGADIIKESGALNYAESLSNIFSSLAVEKIESISSLGTIKDDESLQALKELAFFSSNREK